MKITDVKIEKFEIELSEPFKVAFAEIAHCDNLLIKMKLMKDTADTERQRLLHL